MHLKAPRQLGGGRGGSMKITTLLGTAMALALPMSAVAADNSAFNLVVDSAHFDGSQTYTPARHKTLAEVHISLPSAVQLDGTLAPDLVKAVGANKSATSAGAVLYAADDTHTTYCSTAWKSFAGMPRVTCMIDKDGDGRFEGGVKAAFDNYNSPYLAFSDGRLTGFIGLTDVVTLTEPVPYHRVASSLSAAAGVDWDSDYVRAQSGPVRFAFALVEIGGLQTGTPAGDLFTTPKEVVFDGTPVTVDLYGLRVTIVGIDESGNPICKLEGGIDQQAVRFIRQNIVFTTGR
jgi:hypothetical protein